MSSAQDRSSDLPQGAQASQGASGTGTTAGAAATGMTGDTMTTTGAGTTGGAGMQEPQSANPAYARGTGPAAEYRPESAPSAGYETGAGDGALGGTFLIIAGLLTFFAGLAAVVRVHYFHAVTGYAYAWNAHSWSWAILILGAVLLLVGACAVLGMAWAKPVGVFVAVVTIVGAFMFLVYSPLWGVVLLALSVLAIWGLLRRQNV